MADATTELLDPSFLRLLERLTLSSKRAYAGVLKGEKRSLRRGVSVEFGTWNTFVCPIQPGDQQSSHPGESPYLV